MSCDERLASNTELDQKAIYALLNAAELARNKALFDFASDLKLGDVVRTLEDPALRAELLRQCTGDTDKRVAMLGCEGLQRSVARSKLVG
jgi:hypothetical protein